MRRNFDPSRRPEMEEQLLDLRRQGLTLKQICRLDGWPTRPTLGKWMREKPGLAALARIGREEFLASARRYPFDADAAGRLVQRIRLGAPLKVLVREPGLPGRVVVEAWRQARPDFAAELADAIAFAVHNRRRYGRRRRSHMPYDEAVADRIILALVRGAALRALCKKDRSLPSLRGVSRWRKNHPEFDGAVRAAARAAHRARSRAREDAYASPARVAEIERRIAAGASLASLSKEPGMPGRETFYRWARERPDFRDAVNAAGDRRNAMLADQAYDLAQTRGLAAEPEVRAIFKRLGALSQRPGEGRRKR